MDQKADNLARLYALRILNHLKHRPGWRNIGRNDDLFFLLDIEQPEDSDSAPNYSALIADALKRMERYYKELDHELVPSVHAFAESLNLTELDAELLQFAVLVEFTPYFVPADTLVNNLDRNQFAELAGVALQRSRIEILDRMQIQRPLYDCGLLDICNNGHNTIRSKMKIYHGLDGLLEGSARGAESVMDRLTKQAPTPKLGLDAFSYMDKEVTIARSVLAHALAKRTPGVSLLLYGPPGLGKSEFARALVKVIGATAFEPVWRGEREYDDERIRDYMITQRLLAQRHGSVLIADEAEDMFEHSGFFCIKPKAHSNKSWLTRSLETAPVPSIWIANDVSMFEPAYLRRFTYAIQFEAPPQQVRRKILDETFSGVGVSESWLEQRARELELPPAVSEMAARVARMVDDAQPAEAVADQALEVARELLDLPEPANDAAFDSLYDPAFLNVELDMGWLVAALREHGGGRVCLYGPPGTGKSALVAHLARELDRPLLRKTASEIVACFLGQTEKNIARMFREAKREDAVLLLDEADSFLRDRASARHSWEVTEVNELLARMERYEGIFFCTTNLKDTLDAASLRRFDLKLECDWLRPEQAVALAGRHLEHQGLDWPAAPDQAASLKARLGAIENLAPGDYTAVLRGLRLQGGLRNAAQLVKLLEQECAAKPDAPKKQGVGFV